MASPPKSPTTQHQAPSLPNSPLAKRPKSDHPIIDAAATTAPKALPPPPPLTTDLSTSPPLLIKKLSPKARAPTRGSAFAAGYDLYSAQDSTVPGRGKATIDTDLAIAVPSGTYGRVAPRSGLAARFSIDVGAGVIDSDYRGMVKVLLFNYSDADYHVKEGDRIAQLILERIYTPDVLEVEELEASVRGAGGFGSTG